MRNHYFIGIGGTGGNILREIRETQFVRRQATAQSGVNCEFLYADSNAQELNSDRWRILGTSVRLDTTQRLLILEGDLSQAIASIGQRPALTGWIGRLEVIAGLLRSATGVPGAQQRRRFGRFLFAVHAQDFVEKVKKGIEGLMARGNEVSRECTFHLMGTLAGGTGSGGLVDAALLLRQAYPDPARFPIKLYCLITDSTGGGADVGYFYPNQYAALRDINAVMCGMDNFHDLMSPTGGRAQTQGRAPIMVCYLTSHANESNVALDKGRQERLIGEWLVEVTQAEAGGRVDPRHLKTLTGEDLLPTFPGEPLSQIERSYAFASLGIRRWAIPQPLLRERIACTLARAVADQMLYSNWATGYQDQKLPSNSTTFLNQNSPSSLGLDYRQIADPEASAGRGIDQEWAIALRNLRGRATTQPEALAALERAAQDFGRDSFLSSGVKAFYGGQKNQIGTTVPRIVGDVCARLHAALARREIGIEDVIICLERYMGHIHTQFELLQTDEAGRKQLVLEADRRLEEIRNKWRRPGFFAALFGVKKTLLNHAVTALGTGHSSRAWLEGCDLARVTLQQITTALQTVHSGVVTFKSALLGVRRSVEERASAALRHLAARDDLMMAEWDALALSRLEENILKSETYMPIAAKAAYEKILQGVGVQALASRADQVLIREELVAVGDRVGRDAHEHFATANPADRVLNENIVRALLRRFNGRPEELRNEVESFVRGAVTALALDGAAVQPAASLGSAAPSMPKRGLLLLVPSAEEEGIHRFREELVKTFRGSIPSAADLTVEVANDISEITLIAANRWLGARFAAPLAELKRKYQSSLEIQHLNTRYFSNLDEESQGLPDLFMPDTAAVREEGAGWIELAQRLKIIESDGANTLVLMRTDSQGVIVPERLGSREQALARPDSAVQATTLELRRIAGAMDKTILAALDEELLAEQRTLSSRIAPVLPEYETARQGLQWQRDQLRALMPK